MELFIISEWFSGVGYGAESRENFCERLMSTWSILDTQPGISRNLVREDMARKCILAQNLSNILSTGCSREILDKRTRPESVYTPPLVRLAGLLEWLIMFLRDEEPQSYRRGCPTGWHPAWQASWLPRGHPLDSYGESEERLRSD